MLRHLFRSLRHRDFRLYYLGQIVSTSGSWMQNVAQAWLVYQLSHSSLMLGLVAFCGLAPVLVLGLPAGILADRYPRRRLLIVAQSIAMLQALSLGTLVLTGTVAPWHIVVLALLLGLVHAIEMPSRHSFIAQLVPREDLANAIALNSSVFNLARFVGPALAGWLIAVLGEGPVFLINAASFLGVLAVLFTIRNPETAPGAAAGARHWEQLIGGLRYAWNERRIRNALSLLAAVSMGGTAYSVLMPIFSTQVFSGDALTLGSLLGSAGVGALLAAFRLAYLGGRQQLEQQIGYAAMSGGGGMLVFSTVGHYWMALPLLVVMGFSLTTLIASINTLLQMLTPDGLRGRVMALFSVLFIGINSLSNLLAGSVAHLLGAPVTVSVFGTLCLTAGAIYVRHTQPTQSA